MGAFKFGPFEVGPNTLWLDAHGMLMVIVIASLAFVAGALWFAQKADRRLLRGLAVASAFTFLAVVGLTLTGLVPDVAFEKGDMFSGTVQNPFGTFQATVTDENVGAFTAPLLFDMMEHVSLVVPGLALLLWFWIRHHGPRVVEDPLVRRTALVLVGANAFWLFVLGGIGVYMTKVLTFPYAR
jgi:hypothetical protein